MVVVRSMELTQKKKTLTFKQLDGVLRMMDPHTGERVSLSHKCSELDKQLPSLLGISGPILDNVLFCHQEDASWPLQEGAVLKKRFDDIFDSTRYTKALEIFRKTEKDLQSKSKDIKEEIAALNSHKYAAEGFRAELREQSEYEEELAADKSKLTEEIAQIEKEIHKYNDITDKVDEMNAEIDSLKNDLGRHKVALMRQKEMVDEDLTEKYSRDDLVEMLRDFDSKTLRHKEHEEKLLKQAEAIQADIDNYHNQISELRSKIGKFEAEEEAHEKRLKERVTMMESLARGYNVDLDLSESQNVSFVATLTNTQTTLDTTVISPDDMRGFFRALDRKTEELNEEMKKHRERSQASEDSYQKLFGELNGQLKTLENGTFYFVVCFFS